MKIRNGFVSNSSSSSFIIFLPEKGLALKEVEDYFGGYNNNFTQREKDLLTLTIWREQDKKRKLKYTSSEDTEVLYSCKKYSQTGEPLCFYRRDFDEKYPEKRCKECEDCEKIERPLRFDDYYYLIDYVEDSLKEKIKENSDMSVYKIEIDDNEPPENLSFEEAYELRSLLDSLESTEKMIKEY